jgi:endonuclease G
MPRSLPILLPPLLLILSAGPARCGEGAINLALGNPSHARPDPDDKDNYLLLKKQYALAYNNAKGTPNWVSWRLVRADLGDAPRKQFHPDASLPRGFKKVTPKDYSDSGFDRGHLCPHGDRSATAADSNATFAMTNMAPQSPELNQHAWNDFEIYCRDLVRRHGKRLYLVCGPAGVGGVGRHGYKRTIADGKVTVPAKCWKVVLVLDADDGDDVDRVTARTRLIAVVMPNNDSVTHDWARYRTSVKAVEELTGYTFFGKVPAEVINPLKEKVDRTPIPPVKRPPRRE